MDIHTDIVKWLRKMGYNGQIPQNLVGICNNSTKFIWEQLMQNVRPKQEVEYIKRNIILNRLRAKPLNKQDEFLYKVKEIEEYKQKVTIEQKLKMVDEMVQEKQYKVDQLSQKCKMKDVSLDFLKRKIKENEERKYLLDAKKKQLELQNSQAKESLTKLRNVTPVEREESSNAKEISETLEKCAEKLNKMLIENQKLILQKLHVPASASIEIKKKNSHDQSSVATYLSIQEKANFEEITSTCKKQAKDKENVDSNIQHVNKKIVHRLFDIPQVIIEDAEKSSFERLGVDILPCTQNGSTEISPLVSKRKARDSLGLLPDSCLDKVDNNDSFLRIGDTSSQFDSESVFNKTQDSIFLSGCNTLQRSNNSDDSVVFNFKVPKDRNVVRPAKSESGVFNFKVPEKRNVIKPAKLIEELYRNVPVNRDLEKLLHENNRELIYEMLQKCIQNVKLEFTKIVSMEKGVDERENRVNEDDIAKLRFIHAQTEFKIIQQKKIVKDLIAKIGRKKLQLLSSIKSKEHLIEAQDWLEANIRQVALDASLAAMKKEINSSEIVENNDNDLQVLSSRIMKIKNKIANKMHLIQLTIGDLYDIQKNIAATRESVLSPIWHIRMFKTDTDWMNPLMENTWSEEMRVFENFPLEYQRRCIYTDPKTFYRDLCVDNYPQDSQISSDDLKLLCEILESPFNPPETILLDIIKAKMKMDVLKSFRNKSPNSSFVERHEIKYSFEDLQRQESYLEYAVDRLKSLMFSSDACKTLSVGEVVKRTLDIWTEMPMKDFISDKRLYEGQNYRFYQNKLNSFV